MNKKRIVILSGAGLDKESGIETFRDSKDSLWNNHKIEDVASPAGFARNPQLVLDFYNERRRKLAEVQPNQAHYDLVHLEDYYDVFHITQNVSDLLERAGSSNILHLHGELTKARSIMYSHKTSPFDESIEIGYNDINFGDTNEHGVQLRPDIVWFGEPVTKIPEAERFARSADIFMVIGTSMVVYPAGALVLYVPKTSPIYFIDPVMPSQMIYEDRVTFIQEPATTGVAKAVGELIKKAIEN
ncbi:MAG: Sir2 family NAD-dependent protein deacetylase [Nanoarchaeota archaeon]